MTQNDQPNTDERKNIHYCPLTLATKLFENGRLQECRHALESIVKCSPEDARARDLLGKTLWSSGETEAAIRELEKSLEINPRQPQLVKYIIERMGDEELAVSKWSFLVFLTGLADLNKLDVCTTDNLLSKKICIDMNALSDEMKEASEEYTTDMKRLRSELKEMRFNMQDCADAKPKNVRKKPTHTMFSTSEVFNRAYPSACFQENPSQTLSNLNLNYIVANTLSDHYFNNLTAPHLNDVDTHIIKDENYSPTKYTDTIGMLGEQSSGVMTDLHIKQDISDNVIEAAILKAANPNRNFDRSTPTNTNYAPSRSKVLLNDDLNVKKPTLSKVSFKKVKTATANDNLCFNNRKSRGNITQPRAQSRAKSLRKRNVVNVQHISNMANDSSILKINNCTIVMKQSGIVAFEDDEDVKASLSPTVNQPEDSSIADSKSSIQLLPGDSDYRFLSSSPMESRDQDSVINLNEPLNNCKTQEYGHLDITVRKNPQIESVTKAVMKTKGIIEKITQSNEETIIDKSVRGKNSSATRNWNLLNLYPVTNLLEEKCQDASKTTLKSEEKNAEDLIDNSLDYDQRKSSLEMDDDVSEETFLKYLISKPSFSSSKRGPLKFSNSHSKKSLEPSVKEALNNFRFDDSNLKFLPKVFNSFPEETPYLMEIREHYPSNSTTNLSCKSHIQPLRSDLCSNLNSNINFTHLPIKVDNVPYPNQPSGFGDIKHCNKSILKAIEKFGSDNCLILERLKAKPSSFGDNNSKMISDESGYPRIQQTNITTVSCITFQPSANWRLKIHNCDDVCSKEVACDIHLVTQEIPNEFGRKSNVIMNKYGGDVSKKEDLDETVPKLDLCYSLVGGDDSHLFLNRFDYKPSVINLYNTSNDIMTIDTIIPLPNLCTNNSNLDRTYLNDNELKMEKNDYGITHEDSKPAIFDSVDTFNILDKKTEHYHDTALASDDIDLGYNTGSESLEQHSDLNVRADPSRVRWVNTTPDTSYFIFDEVGRATFRSVIISFQINSVSYFKLPHILGFNMRKRFTIETNRHLDKVTLVHNKLSLPNRNLGDRVLKFVTSSKGCVLICCNNNKLNILHKYLDILSPSTNCRT